MLLSVNRERLHRELSALSSPSDGSAQWRRAVFPREVRMRKHPLVLRGGWMASEFGTGCFSWPSAWGGGSEGGGVRGTARMGAQLCRCCAEVVRSLLETQRRWEELDGTVGLSRTS